MCIYFKITFENASNYTLICTQVNAFFFLFQMRLLYLYEVTILCYILHILWLNLLYKLSKYSYSLILFILFFYYFLNLISLMTSKIYILNLTLLFFFLAHMYKQIVCKRLKLFIHLILNYTLTN